MLLTADPPSPPVTARIAFLAEAIGTGILSFVIFALTNSKNNVMGSGFVPPIIGLTVGSLIAVLAPLTQAGFNPGKLVLAYHRTDNASF